MKKWTVLGGLGLIALGCFAFLNAILAELFNWSLGLVNFWPLLIGTIGIAFSVIPFAFPERRDLSALFIPGFLLTMLGALFTWSSLTNWWGIMEHVWPLLIVAFSAGFFAAALRMRNVWLLIPAILFGVNGVVMLFTAVTGLWHWWSVLWAIEPLAIGLALYVPGALTNQRGLKRAGTILMLIALAAFSMMTMLLAGAVGFVGAGLLTLAGLLLIGSAVMRRNGDSAELAKSATPSLSTTKGSISADDLALQKKVEQLLS